jgi:hypothetical protein
MEFVSKPLGLARVVSLISNSNFTVPLCGISSRDFHVPSYITVNELDYWSILSIAGDVMCCYFQYIRVLFCICVVFWVFAIKRELCNKYPIEWRLPHAL